MLTDADARGMRVEIIPVSYPEHLSPLTLPIDERRRLAEALRTQEAAHGRLGLNAPAWDTALQLLDSDDDGSAAVTEVQLAAPSRRLAMIHADALLAESMQVQTDYGGAAPLRVEVVDGVVTSTDCPAWATSLTPSRWVGLRDEDVLGVLCQQFEGEAQWETRTRWAQVTEVDLTVTGAERTVRFRVHVFDGPDGDPARRVLVIASSDLAAES
jgi:hypothetical protein